ncbi:MAG: aminotransferase class V-fold PLP-dependent enzyme [Bacteroidia bacterium]|nr:aminotransferase class V-fold PLP-dependent enzyme [Bacteroidia bacterium]
MNINQQLAFLNQTARELDINEEQRAELVQQTTAYLNTFLNNIDQHKAFSRKEAQGLEINNAQHLFSDILEIYQKEVVETGIVASSGGHLGYIPGGGIFAAALADLLAAVTNPYAGVYFASPGAALIETEVVNWLKKVFKFPNSATGVLTSGGSVSNLIAFTAARDKYGVKNEMVKNSVVYLTEQVHHSAQKALRIIGLEDTILRNIPIDDKFRMQVKHLRNCIEQDLQQGLKPFLIIATAGTTDTGAVDPIDDIAEIALKFKLWFHVDAAYGGFFILSSKNEMFKGIEKADSLIVDPHKGLFLPYGLGAVLIKDKRALLHSHQYTGNYMQDTKGEDIVVSPANISPELTRHFRGLRLWLPLKLHGIEPFKACLEEKLLLIQYMREKLNTLGFCLGPEPDLSVSYFWYPFEKDCDQNNKRLMHEIHNHGEVFLSSTIIGGRFVIRMAILAFRTKRKTIDTTLAMIQECLNRVLNPE